MHYIFRIITPAAQGFRYKMQIQLKQLYALDLDKFFPVYLAEK
jgi:hypothetical protein